MLIVIGCVVVYCARWATSVFIHINNEIEDTVVNYMLQL